jgi:CRP-like cAMP-binding protein
MFFINSGLVEILFDAPLMTKHNTDVDEEGGGSGSSPGSSRGGGGGGGGAAMSDAASASSPGTQQQQQQQQHQQLKVLGPGSFFGEGALFSGTRAASIRARTPVRLLALSETSFQKVMHVHPHFAEKIMFLNAERQKLLEQRVAKRNSIYVHQQQLQQRGGKHKRNGTSGGSNGNDVRTVGASRLGQQQQRAVVPPRRPSSLDTTGAAGNLGGAGPPAPSPSRSRGATIGGALPLRAAGPGTGLDNKVRMLVEESRRREGGTPTFGSQMIKNQQQQQQPCQSPSNNMAIASPSAGGGAGGDISGGHIVAAPITPPGNSGVQPAAAAGMLSFPAGSNNAAAGPRVTDLERSLHAGAHPPGYSPVDGDEQAAAAAAAATVAVDTTASLLTRHQSPPPGSSLGSIDALLGGNALAAAAASSASSTILPSGHARRPSMRRRSSEGALGFPAAATSSGNNVGVGGAGGVGFPGAHAHV